MSWIRMLFIVLWTSFSSLPINVAPYECSYNDTINVTGLATTEDGFYMYNNQTKIASNLVSDYHYEILYDNSNRSVPVHKRACFCHLKPCLPLCSSDILDIYQQVLNDPDADNAIKDLFLVSVTLANNTKATRNLVEDFVHVVFTEFCTFRYPLSPETDQNLGWTLLEDGTLWRHSDKVLLSRNEYCFDLYLDELDHQTYISINPFNCARKRETPKVVKIVHYWTQALSVPFFILTIMAYISLPELRDVHGKCLMSYLSCLTTYYSIFSYINLSHKIFDDIPCLLMGYTSYYMQLSQYVWLGIISLDIWKSLSDYDYNPSYLKYALYGYNIPLLMTFLAFLAQGLLNNDLKPGISTARCALEVDKWSAVIYLYGPCSMVLICCLILFILTSRIILVNDEEIVKTNELQYESPRVRYGLYLRLFLMMGLSWFLDVISYFLHMLENKNLSAVLDYINGLQGLYVFVNFIGRTGVRNIIINRFCKQTRTD